MGLREAIEKYDEMSEPAEAMLAAGSVIEEARKLLDVPITDEQLAYIIEWTMHWWDRYYVPEDMKREPTTPELTRRYNVAMGELVRHCRAALVERTIQEQVRRELDETTG